MKAGHVIRCGERTAAAVFLALLLLAVDAYGEGRGTAAISTPTVRAHRSWFERNFKRYSMEEAIALSFSPRDACDIVGRSISYRADIGDEWCSADETWQRGRGDCEDFAVVVQEICSRIGVEVSVYLFFPTGRNDSGHAVAVGQWMGRYWVSSNGSYEETGSLEGVRELVAREMRWEDEDLWHVILDARGTRRFIERDCPANRPS